MRRVYNNNNKMKMLRPASCVIRQPWQSKEHDDGAWEGGGLGQETLEEIC